MADSAVQSNPGSRVSGEGIDHGTLCKWVNEAEDATVAARAASEKCRDYYDSRQWTEAETSALSRRGQAATVINRVKPKIDGLLGMERTQRTTARAFPRTPKEEGGAGAATEAIRYVLQANQYNQTRSGVFENITVEGSGGLEVTVKEKKDGGYDIKITQIMWDRMIHDPHARRKDFSDARYLGQVIWMDYDAALAQFPQGGDVLEQMLGSSGDTYDDKPRWMDTTRRRVKIVELYYFDRGEIYYCCFTRGGELKPRAVSPYVTDSGETEWPYEFESAFVDRDGGRYGAMLQYLDVQDEINKRRSKALHLMSVRQVKVFRGAVDDVAKMRAELAKPDGVIEVTSPNPDDFEVLKTGDMAQAQFNLLTEAKQEIDAVGYNAALSGKDSQAVSGVALRQRQMTGQTELAPLFDCLKHMDYRVYRKVWNRIRQYWTAQMWIRVTDDPQNLRWVGLNQPVTRGEQALQQAGQSGAPPEVLQQLQQQIAMDPAMQQQVATENDVAHLDIDLVLTDAPDAVTTQIEDFQVLGEMVKSGFPMPPQAVIEASPLSNKERILKLMKESQAQQVPPQIQQQMQKMQEELQKLQQENQALKTDQAVDAAKVQADALTKKQELEMKAQAQNEELLLEREKAEAELKLERDKAREEMALEREKAEAELKLEREKMACDVDIQKQKAKDVLAVESVKLQQEIDPDEMARAKERETFDIEARMQKIVDESREQTMKIVGALIEAIQTPKKKTATYKGQTITVIEQPATVQ